MTEQLHLSTKHRRILESLLREHLPHVEVWAYGSRVTGRSHDGSDLDLVLRGPDLKEIPCRQIADFEDAVRESRIPFLVEARDWARLPERFHREIEREYIVLRNSRWPAMSLSDAGVALMDCVHRTPAAVNQGFPYVGIPQVKNGRIEIESARRISPQDFYQWTRKANPKRYDVVLSRRCNPGETGFVSGDTQMALGQNLVLLRADGQQVFEPFLRWLVRGPEWWEQVAKYLNVGAVFDSLKCADIPKFKLTLPPLSEQSSIAHILGTLDDKIEINLRMNKTLETIARAIFKDWFVDFGPTRAKAEGCNPYLPQELWDILPDQLDDEGKPAGWSLATLMALATINPESWSSEEHPEQIEYVDLANTKWGRIEATQRFTWQDAPSRAKRVLRPGDTIVGTVRPGNGSFAFIGGAGMTGSTGFAVVRPLEKRYGVLVYLAATAPENIQHLANQADGAAYPAVRPEVVGGTEIAVASDLVIDSFSTLISPIFDRMLSNRREEDNLAQIRDSLLPKLISGEISCQDAEKLVEAVV